MDKFKLIDKLVMKYLIIGILLVVLVLNHQSIFSWFQDFWRIISPLIFGAVIAYVLNLLMRQFEKLYFPENNHPLITKTRRPVSILLSFVVILLIILFVLNMVIPQLLSVLSVLINALPTAFESLQSWIINNEELFPPIAAFVEQTDINWQRIVRNTLNMINDLTTSLIETTLSTVYSLFGTIINLFLSFMISIYILMSKEKLKRQFQRLSSSYLPTKVHDNLMYVINVANYSFSHFIPGQVVEAIISGIIVTVGMLIFQFPYATMIGAVTGVTTLIPILGAYLSGAIGIILILPHSIWQAFAFLIFIVVVQQIEGNIIYPRVVGGSIGLPGLWVLVSVTIGGGLAGIWGLLLAVPTASIIYHLVSTDVREREQIEKQRIEEEMSYSLEVTSSPVTDFEIEDK